MTLPDLSTVARWASVAALLLSPAHALAQTCSPAEQVIRIDDAGLREALLKRIEEAEATKITCGALEDIDSLDARGLQIRSLSGLQHARNLVRLDLGDNKIRDLTALGRLEHLTQLRLDGNLIADLRPLLRNKLLATGLALDVARNCIDLVEGSDGAEAIETLKERGIAVEYRPQKASSACQ
jgi:Leucine-rich repeat (LRR) protein